MSAGGFGAVHRARHRQLDRIVALKILHAEQAAAPDAVRRFAQEARATASLNHPNIVKVLDFGLSKEGPWIAYEYLSGERLADVLERGGLPLRETLAMVRSITEALGAAHSAGILHRDIKPANIMPLEEGGFKLIDFGIARLRHGAPVHTQAGALFGTPEYMAPEYVARGEFDPRSDLYSLGIVFFRCATGELPFRGPGAPEVFKQLLTAEPPRPSGLAPGLPAAIERLILDLLARDPADRPSDAAALLARLDLLIAATEGQSGPAPTR